MKATTKGAKKIKPKKPAAAKKSPRKETVAEKPTVKTEKRVDKLADTGSIVPDRMASAKNKSGIWLVMGLLGLVVVVGGPLVWPRIELILKPYLAQFDFFEPNKLEQQVSANNDAQIKKRDNERNQLREQIKKITTQVDALQKEISAVRDKAAQASNKQPTTASENPVLKQSVDALNKRVVQLESGLSNDNKDVMAGLRTLQQKQLDRQTAEAGWLDVQERLTKDVAAIKLRLADLENNKSVGPPIGNNDAALVLAIQQLRDTFDLGKPFEKNLQTVRVLAQGSIKTISSLTVLSAVAGKGVPTMNMIRDGFDTMVTDVLKTKGAKPGDDIIDKALLKIRSIVTIRRTDDRGDDVEQLLNQAENRLQVSDLAGVIQAMEQLNAMLPTTAAASNKWLGDVRMRLGATEALSNLYGYAISKLTITKPKEQG